jgi:negative regulator of sigma E activity
MNNCILLQQVQSISVASPSRVRSLKVLDLNILGINGLKVLKETIWQAGLTTVVVSGLDENRIQNLGDIPPTNMELGV